MNGLIVCDARGCGWKLLAESIIEWRDADCPKCGSPLMDEIDKRGMDVIIALERDGLVKPGTPDSALTLRLDTAKFTRP